MIHENDFGEIDPENLLRVINGSRTFIPTSPPFTPPREGSTVFVRKYQSEYFRARLVIYYRGRRDYDMVALLIGSGIKPVRLKFMATNNNAEAIWLKKPHPSDIALLKLSFI